MSEKRRCARNAPPEEGEGSVSYRHPVSRGYKELSKSVLFYISGKEREPWGLHRTARGKDRPSKALLNRCNMHSKMRSGGDQ